MTTPADPTRAATIADRVRHDLATRHWSHVGQPIDASDFEAVAARLGTVDRRLEVVVSPEREQEQRSSRRNNLPRPSLYQSTELGFHTDPPRTSLGGGADVLAFYCLAQDDHDGASLLIDMSRLEHDFTPDEIDGLRRVEVAYSTIRPDGVDELHTLPLLSRDADRISLHYMPWGVRLPTDPALARLMGRFEQYARDRPVVSIRLKAGESLFLDNRVMLHGRGPLLPDSKRRLLRVHLGSAAPPG